MFQIHRIEVDGFWETHQLKVQLFSDVTFFIGPNGTGKTTFINLLAAALTGDFVTLEKIDFKRITISLRAIEGPRRPSIIVSKAPRKERGIEGIDYRIKVDLPNNPELKFSFDEVQDFFLRHGEVPPRNVRSNYYRRASMGVEAALKDLIQVQWLSVHRAPIRASRDERTYESAVDRKLEDLSNDLVRYFATFQKEKDEQVRLFQEYIFFSLLEPAEDLGALFSKISEEPTEDHQMMMVDIFKELHVADTGIGERISSFFESAGNAARNLTNSNPLTMKDISLLIGLRRINGVADRWKTLQSELSEIFAPRDNFIRITNELLQRKRVEINDSNELVFVSRTGKPLTSQMLSSGEKQLMILLSEVLLQRQTPAIFIADEPELSLHVTWQEKLVSSLRRLNPYAQIVAATHSPDIVGQLSDRAIDMETIIP
jgi:predicted ATPase